MIVRIAAAALATFAAACSTTPSVPQAVRDELAPTGVLRAGMNTGNTLFTTKGASGELQGVSVDIMQELGRRLGVPVRHVVYATPGQVADDAASGKWDVAILAIEQARAEKIAFSPAMTEIEATYLVPQRSTLQQVSEVDAPGHRIAVSEKAGYDLYLTRTLRHATLVRGKAIEGAIEVFRRQDLDALAGLRPQLLERQHEIPGARILDGGFMTVNHGIGTPRDRSAGAEYIRRVVDELNASGFIARSIERHRVKGLAAVSR
ncbi:MAG TPA: transporter substrate-binding domain-containing protein [Usitatibacter sp.]|nr:transporter substrate-binding domain-containing protein [Usitatibacter sp.]